MKLKNGSIASINYFSNGSNLLYKEKVEIFSNGTIVEAIDNTILKVYKNKIKKYNFKGTGKGHKEQMECFFNAIKKGGPLPISFDQLYNTSLTTISIVKSIIDNRNIKLDECDSIS